jgi:hypothetical protein
MFSYIRKINKLYNGDGSEAADGDDGVYLFDSQTIAKWATEAKPEYESGDIPRQMPLFSYN